MNAKRQLSGLRRTDFSKKSSKQTIKYLVKKYELLGYAIPSYLQGKTLSKTQLVSWVGLMKKNLESF